MLCVCALACVSCVLLCVFAHYKTHNKPFNALISLDILKNERVKAQFMEKWSKTRSYDVRKKAGLE